MWGEGEGEGESEGVGEGEGQGEGEEEGEGEGDGMVDGGAGSVMCAYQSVNGVPMCANGCVRRK